MEGVLLRTNDNRVPGIGPAGKTNDYLGLIGQIIHNLTLSLITPLGADNNHIHGDRVAEKGEQCYCLRAST